MKPTSLKVIHIPVERFVPYARNAKKHDIALMEELAAAYNLRRDRVLLQPISQSKTATEMSIQVHKLIHVG